MVMEIWDKPDNLDVIVSCLVRIIFLLRPLNLSSFTWNSYRLDFQFISKIKTNIANSRKNQ